MLIGINFPASNELQFYVGMYIIVFYRNKIKISPKGQYMFRYPRSVDLETKLSSRNFSQKTNERICFSILTTRKYLKLEFRFQVGSCSMAVRNNLEESGLIWKILEELGI